MVNGQGDVVKLLHGSDTTVAECTYDAWGNVLTVSADQSDDPTIAAQNPLRYRGYYCDEETGFYYLQSRYYDPAVRRFLNADSYASTGQGLLGYNMFAYCNSTPVTTKDSSGCSCVSVSFEGGTRKREKSEYVPGTDNQFLKEAESIEEARKHIQGEAFYNCFGFAIGKAVFCNPSNWEKGDSVYDVFRAVQADLGGSKNCRELSGIDIPCDLGWYKVVLRCTEDNCEYHFIRQIGGTWYSKSGDCPDKPIMVRPSYVTGEMWGRLQAGSDPDVILNSHRNL